jgi:hypothetical protein
MKLVRWQIRLAIGCTAAFWEGAGENADRIVRFLDRLWWEIPV